MRFRVFVVSLLAGILFAGPACAGDDNPDVMLQALYAKYRNSAAWPKGYVPCHEFCAPDFARIVDRAGLDYDPICQCSGRTALLGTVAGQLNGMEYDVEIRDLSHPNLVRRWILCLRVVNGDWRIVDISERQHGGVYRSLHEHLTGKPA